MGRKRTRADPSAKTGKALLQEVHDKVQRGLTFMEQDKADGLVQPGMGEAGVVVEAMVAQHGMLYAELTRNHGLPNTEGARAAMSGNQLVILQLGYLMYAAGIERGRQERNEGAASDD